jgi:hypothetical protein
MSYIPMCDYIKILHPILTHILSQIMLMRYAQISIITIIFLIRELILTMDNYQDLYLYRCWIIYIYIYIYI